MDSPERVSLIAFTDTTKRVCSFSAISMFLIMIFIIGPFSKISVVSMFMKILILLLLCYTIYVNTQQTYFLQNINQAALVKEVSSQLSINIIGSYLFTLFIGILILFVAKSLIY